MIGVQIGLVAALLDSDARTLVDNLAISRGRGRVARTLSRFAVEDWLVRLSQRRGDDWFPKLRERPVELCSELEVFLRAIPEDLDLPRELPALADEPATSLPFFEAYFSNFIEGTEFTVDEDHYGEQVLRVYGVIGG